MSNQSCHICHGTGTVRFACHKPTICSVVEGIAEAVTVSIPIHYTTYPCPECCHQVSEERVFSQTSIPITFRDDLGVRPYAAQTAAHALVGLLLGQKYFTVVDLPQTDSDRMEGKKRLQVSLGVVSAQDRIKIEDRAKQSNEAFGREVVDEVIKQINN